MNKVSISQNEKDSLLEIAGDPKGEYSDSLHFLSVPTSQSRSDTLTIKAASTYGNCNIAEFDIYIASAPNTGIFQIYIGNSFLVQMNLDGGKMRLIAISDESGEALKQEILYSAQGVKANEWHRLRFEAYDSDENDAPVLKLFVDDELIGTTNMYKGKRTGAQYSSTFTGISFYSMKSVTTDIYLDNVYLSREMKDYVADSDDISDMRGN
jgi:hypothetical protein